MNSISQLFFAILMTMMTGTLAFGIWGMVRQMCMRHSPILPYLLLRIVCLLYVFPVCYIWMQLAMRDGFLRVDSIWQMNFAPAGELRMLVVVLATAWVFLTGRQIRVCLFAYVDTWRKYRYNVPEEEPEILEEFERVRKKLGVSRHVRLYKNRNVQFPNTYGIWHCDVVLPAKMYDREQLTVIFHHELTHCKSRDYLYRFLARTAGIIGNMGPISDMLDELLKEWSEYHCDWRAIEALKDEMNATRYFEMIVELTPVKASPQDVNHICLCLYESQFRLGRRIDFMNKYGGIKRKTSARAVLAALAFTLASVTPVYAAGNQVADVHEGLYRNLEYIKTDGVQTEGLEEIYLPASDDTYGGLQYASPEDEYVAPALSADENVAINWTVPSDVRMVSKSFYVKAGQKISMSCTVTPGSSSYWIGIMDGGNDVRYVAGSGSMSHEFAIEKSGFYRVLVQNTSSVTITVNGGYMYYTP